VIERAFLNQEAGIMRGSFILSSARTGSTLTRFIVDTHPEIYCPAELEMGRLAASLYFSIATLEGRLDFPLQENTRVLARVRQTLLEMMESYTVARGKKVWCEKSPANVPQRELLAAVFPEARFVCLYRHGLDVARSCLEASRFGFIPTLEEYVRRTPGDTVRAAVQYWVDDTTALLDFERKRPERSFRLRYEDVTEAPEAALEPMFRFLGVEWTPSLLDSVFTARHDPGIGDGYVRYSGRIHKDSRGLGRTLPLGTLPAELRSRLSSLLEELGYGEEPAAAAAPPVPPPPGASGPRDFRETPAWVFESLLPERLRRQLPATALSCTFVVQGEGGGAWTLEAGKGGFRLTPGGEALARIDVQAADLLDVVHGRANALKIVRDGRIRVSGQLSDEALRDLILLIRTDLDSPP
jgi:protein-tyrosine sulfotransferase